MRAGAEDAGPKDSSDCIGPTLHTPASGSLDFMFLYEDRRRRLQNSAFQVSWTCGNVKTVFGILMSFVIRKSGFPVYKIGIEMRTSEGPFED